MGHTRSPRRPPARNTPVPTARTHTGTGGREFELVRARAGEMAPGGNLGSQLPRGYRYHIPRHRAQVIMAAATAATVAAAFAPPAIPFVLPRVRTQQRGNVHGRGGATHSARSRVQDACFLPFTPPPPPPTSGLDPCHSYCCESLSCVDFDASNSGTSCSDDNDGVCTFAMSFGSTTTPACTPTTAPTPSETTTTMALAQFYDECDTELMPFATMMHTTAQGCDSATDTESETVFVMESPTDVPTADASPDDPAACIARSIVLDADAFFNEAAAHSRPVPCERVLRPRDAARPRGQPTRRWSPSPVTAHPKYTAIRRRRVQCDQCDNTFASKARLAIHVHDKHRIRPCAHTVPYRQTARITILSNSPPRVRTRVL